MDAPAVRIALRAGIIALALLAAFAAARTAGVELARRQGWTLFFTPYPDDAKLLLRRSGMGEDRLLRDEPLPAGALQVARTAHAIDPLDPLPFMIAGRIARTEGDRARARDAFAEAMRRDPRAYLPRFEVIRELLLTGRDREAIAVVVKTAALRPDQDQSLLGALVLAQGAPDGRAMILSELRRFPEVRKRMAVFASRLPDQGALVAALLAEGVDPATRDAMVAALAHRGAFAAANLLWQGSGSPAQRAVPFDGTLKGLKAPAPFGWQLQTDASLNAFFDTAGAGGLVAEYYGTLDTDVATQTVLLRPGPHVLRVVGVGESAPGTEGEFVWTLTCTGERDPLAVLPFPADRPGRSRRTLDFTVPANCPAQQLTLTARPAQTGIAFRHRFTSVALDPS